MNLLMIGYGATATSHTRIFAEAGITLDTIVGRVPEKVAAFAAEHGYAHGDTDLAAALASRRIDIVVVASPSEAHAGQTRQALESGAHVLVEIPLAMNYAEGRELAALARACGKTLMVAHTHRYRAAAQEARQKIAVGALTVHHVVSRYMFLRRENRDWSGRERSWTDNLLWHHGCHAVDLSLWLLGVTDTEGLSVTAQIALPDQAMGVPLDLSVLVRTPQDQLVSVNMSYNSHLNLYDYVLVGREESLLIDGNAQDGVPGFEVQDHAFLDAVRNGTEPPISAASVLPALWVLQQAQDLYDAWRQAHPATQHPLVP